MNIITSDESGFIKHRRFNNEQCELIQRIGKLTHNADPYTSETSSGNIIYFGSRAGNITIKSFDNENLEDIMIFSAFVLVESKSSLIARSPHNFDSPPDSQILSILIQNDVLFVAFGNFVIARFKLDYSSLKVELLSHFEIIASDEIKKPNIEIFLLSSKTIAFFGAEYYDAESGKKIGELRGPDYVYLDQYWPKFEVSNVFVHSISNSEAGVLGEIRNSLRSEKLSDVLKPFLKLLFEKENDNKTTNLVQNNESYEIVFACTNDGFLARYEGFCFDLELPEIPPTFYQLTQEQQDEKYRITAVSVDSDNPLSIQKSWEERFHSVLNTFLHKLYVYVATDYVSSSSESIELFNYLNQEFIRKMKTPIACENMDSKDIFGEIVRVYVATASGFVAALDSFSGCFETLTVREHYGSVRALEFYHNYIISGGTEKYLRIYDQTKVDGVGRDGLVVKDYNVGNVVGITVFKSSLKTAEISNNEESLIEEEESLFEEELREDESGFTVKADDGGKFFDGFN